ncbi:MAG: ribonuclease III [Ilumatobacteraceae bacterium]
MGVAGVFDPALLEALENRIGHRFADRSLLEQALVHRSWHAENPLSPGTNERLEFLGDAVLGFVVADVAFREMEEMPEGRLTDLRIAVVNTGALAQLARDLRVGECVQLGKGEDAAGGRDKDSILADAMEAVIAAVHLDAGIVAAHALVSRLFAPAIADVLPHLDMFDAKSRLQELCARLGSGSPSYDTTGEGPDHERTFTSRVTVGGRVCGTGTGRTKKAAEQMAATEAHRLLSE